MARSARRLLRSTTPRAGGTIGLSQLASKRSGESNQLTVMGLVMLGAIQTNESPVDLSIVTPIASLSTEQKRSWSARSRSARRWTTWCPT